MQHAGRYGFQAGSAGLKRVPPPPAAPLALPGLMSGRAAGPHRCGKIEGRRCTDSGDI